MCDHDLTAKQQHQQQQTFKSSSRSETGGWGVGGIERKLKLPRNISTFWKIGGFILKHFGFNSSLPLTKQNRNTVFNDIFDQIRAHYV